METIKFNHFNELLPALYTEGHLPQNSDIEEMMKIIRGRESKNEVLIPLSYEAECEDIQIHILLDADKDISSEDVISWMKKVKRSCPKSKIIYLQNPFASPVISYDHKEKKFIRLIVKKNEKKY